MTTKKTKRRAAKRPVEQRAATRRPCRRRTLIAPGYHIVGFCDVGDKARGRGDIVYFKKKHILVRPKLPTRDQLRAHALAHGYYPSGKTGVEKDRCDPVYLFVEHMRSVR